jgi:signal transduction histidine kinase
MDKDERYAEGMERAGEDDWRRAVARCEARLTEIADLTARARHEINNPLTGLIGQTQLLLREELNETALRRVQIIEQLAARIRDIVAELRVVQRPNPQTLATGAETDDATDPPRH